MTKKKLAVNHFPICSRSAVRVVREPLQHTGRAGTPPLHCGRRPHHHAALPGAQAQQAHHLRRVAQLRQMGDGAHRHHDEAQAGWRPVRRGVRGRVEEVQPDCGRQDAEGEWLAKTECNCGAVIFFALFMLAAFQ